MSIDFIVHPADESVSVVVDEGIQAGQTLTGWVMEGGRTITFKVLDAIPIGHKLAIQDLAEADTAIKYGVDIGRVSTFTSRTSKPRGGKHGNQGSQVSGLSS